MRYEIYEDHFGDWRWKLRDDDEYLIDACKTEYESKDDVLAAIDKEEDIPLVDITGDSEVFIDKPDYTSPDTKEAIKSELKSGEISEAEALQRLLEL